MIGRNRATELRHRENRRRVAVRSAHRFGLETVRSSGSAFAAPVQWPRRALFGQTARLVIRTSAQRLRLRLHTPHPDRYRDARRIYHHPSRVRSGSAASLEATLCKSDGCIKIMVNRKLDMVYTYVPAVAGFSPPYPAFFIHQAKPSPESSIGSIRRNRGVRPGSLSQNSAHMYSKSPANYTTICESGCTCEQCSPGP